MLTYDVAEILSLTENVETPGMGDFSMTPKDMQVALALFKIHQPRKVLEFGVCQGHTAAFLLKHCPFIEVYVGVDLKPELFPERGIVPEVAGRLAAADSRYVSLLTDETVEDFQAQLRALGEEPFDCAIMDANHEDWATKRDTEAVDWFLEVGGLWLWHDYDVESRQHSNGEVFSLKGYLDALMLTGRCIHTPRDVDRDPWTCCSLAWEVNDGLSRHLGKFAKP